jgi:hypothetical protein
MPHYHLNLYNDVDVVDEEGSEFADLAAAEAAAARSARELMAEHVTSGLPLDLNHRVEVVTGDGTVVSVLRFGDLITIKGG